MSGHPTRSGPERKRKINKIAMEDGVYQTPLPGSLFAAGSYIPVFDSQGQLIAYDALVVDISKTEFIPCMK